jgi:hypothetical protein
LDRKRQQERLGLTKNSTRVNPSELTAFENEAFVKSRTSEAEAATAESARAERAVENFMVKGGEGDGG